jgi:hypothetical protein
MAKYTFSKPFSKQIAVGGVVGLGTYSKNVGDVVEGDVVNDKQTGEQQLKVLINKFPIQGADMFVYIPFSYLTAGGTSSSGSGNGSQKTSQTFFTPKNIIIGLLAIGVIIGGLKLAKVF